MDGSTHAHIGSSGTAYMIDPRPGWCQPYQMRQRFLRWVQGLFGRDRGWFGSCRHPRAAADSRTADQRQAVQLEVQRGMHSGGLRAGIRMQTVFVFAMMRWQSRLLRAWMSGRLPLVQWCVSRAACANSIPDLSNVVITSLIYTSPTQRPQSLAANAPVVSPGLPAQSPAQRRFPTTACRVLAVPLTARAPGPRCYPGPRQRRHSMPRVPRPAEATASATCPPPPPTTRLAATRA